jgi:signal transduction histidine kinase
MPRNLGHIAVCQLRALMLTVLFGVLAAPAAAQDDLIESVGLFEDETTSLGIQDVLQETFQPIKDTISLGYTTSAEWVRLRILPAQDGGEVVVLFGSGMPYDLRFYRPKLTGSGDGDTELTDVQYQLLAPDWPSPLPGFRVSPPDGGADYFVRIESSGAIWLDINALPQSTAITTTKQSYILQITYLSLMFVLFLWALNMLVITREALFSWFAALQFFWLVNNTLYLGYGDSLLPQLPHDRRYGVFRASVFISAFFSVAFHCHVMRRFDPAWLARRLFDIQLVVIVCAFGLFVFFDPILALKINAACLAAAPFVFLANAATAKKAASPGLVTMRVIYGLLSMSFFFNAFAVLGVINITALATHGYMIHGSSTGLLMFLLLHLRARDLFQAARQAEADKFEMEKQTDLQKEQNHKLSEFIEMLGHEAKNALAVINISISTPNISDRQRARASEAIHGLTSLIDRCDQLIAVDKNEQALNLRQCDVIEILQKLRSGSMTPSRIRLQAPDQAVVLGDPVLLGVVFGNLLENALKYAPSNSDIWISICQMNDGYSILFENLQGDVGAPDPDKVFQRYYRNPLAKREIGSGLGLYIAHSLTALMGGRLDYVRQDQRIGFRVWFP